MSAAEDFRSWLQLSFGVDPGNVIADGKWHRFNPGDTRHKSSKPARYLVHADGKANGIYMDWRHDEKVRHKWFGGQSGETIDRAAIDKLRSERRQAQDAAFSRAADDAATYWSACPKINGASHPYLDAKQISPCGARQGSGKRFGLGDVPCVVVPLSGPEGNALSLQAIREDGERRFWPGSTKDGAHFAIGKDDGSGPVVFCEGFSTAASIAAATGLLTVMCLEASNMANVARWASHKYAGRDLIVAGDDDWHLVGHPTVKRNVGRDAALAMASSLGGRAVFPQMHGLVTDGGDDFNDVACEYGLEEVDKQFTAFIAGERPEPAEDDRLVKATPFEWRDVSEIPKRQWLYGKHLLRKFVSVDVAAGGVGKSSLKIGEAIAMAAGRDIYQKGLPEGALSVWLWNLEDPLEEMERRIHATCDKFAIRPNEMAGRLYVDSGRDSPLVIATEGPDGAQIARPVVDALIREMIARKIDVLTVDPFISSHQVSENDNNAIDIVAREWNVIAERTGAAVNLVHHVRKGNGAEATADSARGASALIGKARSVIVYNRMTADEAATLGVQEQERRFYFRTDNDKANLAPPDATEWYRMNNVDLRNGDSVGVACAWTPPDAFEGVTVQMLISCQRVIAGGKWRENSQAKAWAGHAIGPVLGLNSDDKRDKKRISTIIRRWVHEGAFRIVIGEDEKRMEREFIEVGELAEC
jgi:hypothetical protein